MVNLEALEMFNEWFKNKKEKKVKKLMISDKDYKELKEMYDWERKVEFNKELLRQNRGINRRIFWAYPRRGRHSRPT